jgi:hypothetical protein
MAPECVHRYFVVKVFIGAFGVQEHWGRAQQSGHGAQDAVIPNWPTAAFGFIFDIILGLE